MHIKMKLISQPTMSVDRCYAIPLWASRKDLFCGFLEGKVDRAVKAMMQSLIG